MRTPTLGRLSLPKLAEIATKRFSKLQNSQKIQELQVDYPVPKSCDGMRVPKVISEIWRSLAQRQHKHLRVRDLKITATRRSIVAESAAVLQLMEVFTQASEAPNGQQGVVKTGFDDAQLQKLFKIGLQILTLLGHANYELSLRRRESTRPLLKQDLAAPLCGNHIPVIQSLFGDEFSRCLKEAKQVAQMGRDASGSGGYGWKRGEQSKSGSRNFRGKWKPWKAKNQRSRKNEK